MENKKFIFFIIISVLFLFVPNNALSQSNRALFQRSGNPGRIIHGIENIQNVSQKELEPLIVKSVHLSTEYLKRSTYEYGKFQYLNYLNSEMDDTKYNELRHAGTIYSLELYNEKYPNDSVVEVIKISSKYLMECCIKEVPGKKNLLAVWTNPYIAENPHFRQAKLGGAGLGLVSLVGLKKLDNNAVEIDMLRKIADFILFMQKDNGSYYSKYKPLKGGRNDEWTSLYYPGEAALGLALLYEIDKDPKWIQGAIKTITYLANSRKHSKVVPEDHWAMLATNQIFKLSKTNDFKFPKKLFVDHAVKVCNSLLKMFVFENWDGTYKLKSLKTGRTAPVGTRLEGLLAAYQFLPDNLTVLKNNIKGAAESGMKFLISAQVVSGKYKGGFPGQVIYYSSRNMYKIDPEIRIDYVQHAMSAQINYLELFYK